jgi:hypothetical protein
LFGTSLTQLLAAEEGGNVVQPRAKSVMFLVIPFIEPRMDANERE